MFERVYAPTSANLDAPDELQHNGSAMGLQAVP
jgi:hypothetical protein